MLSNYTQTVNANAASVVDGKVIMYMAASIRSSEPPSITTSYQDVTAYRRNTGEADADLEQFRQMVLALSKGEGEGVMDE